MRSQRAAHFHSSRLLDLPVTGFKLIEATRGEDVKPKDAFIRGTVMLLAISGSGAFADPPGKEDWEPRKERMGYEREQRKRDRQWEREERKYYKKLERKERKHVEKMTRKERKYQEEMWREGDYTLEDQGDGYGVDQPYEPDYTEDKIYRIIKDLRDLTEPLNQ